MIHNSKLINWFTKNKDIIIVFFLYSLLAIIFTWPVIIKFSTVIYGQSGDPFYNLWVFHNLAGGNLSVAVPVGLLDSNHIITPNQPLIDFVAKYLTLIFHNEVIAYNSMVILSFPLSGLALYLIVKTLTKSAYAGFFAGLIFAFSPYHLAHGQYHINLLSIYWLGFFVYFLIKLWQIPNIKNLIIASVFFALTMMDSYQYGFFAAVILGLFLLYLIVTSWIKNQKIYLNSKNIYYSLLGVLIVAAIIWLFDRKSEIVVCTFLVWYERLPTRSSA